MTKHLAFTWEESGLACTLCNPSALADLETTGVRVTGPCWVVCICVDCLHTLEGMLGQDHVQVPLSPEVEGLVTTQVDRDAVTAIAQTNLRRRDQVQ